MTDREFDLLLESELTDLPPTDDLVAEITPWRRATHRILLGMALCGITLNFLLLDHILPTIGIVLILLGFRSLRRENGWFAVGYAAAIVRMAIRIFTAIVNATIWQSDFYGSPAGTWLTALGLILTTLHALCIWGGFRAVQLKAGAGRRSRGFWLVVYYALLSVLAVANFQGTLVILALLVIYILLLRGLWKYSSYLEDAGYTVQASPVRLSDRAVGILIAAIVVIGIACGYAFFNQYPMDWAEKEEISAEAEEVKADLRELGFPEDVLEDLTEEDILACRDAGDVYSETQEQAFNDGVSVDDSGSYYTYIHTEYPVKELLVTHVLVEPEDGDRWIIFEHFLWQTETGYRGTDIVQVWPAYAKSEGWAKGSRLSGRVLYDSGDLTYTAPYYSLEERTYTTSGFFGAFEHADILASFSLPYRGERCRGYVCYDMEMVEDGWLVNSWCNYAYQRTPVYPALTADEFVMSGYSLNDYGYRTRQSQFSIRPSQIDGTYEPEE